MVIDGKIMKDRHIIILEELQKQVLAQLHSYHMGIEKITRLLAHESIYWIHMNADIEKHIQKLLYIS